MESRKLNSIVFEHLRIDEESFKKGYQYLAVQSHPTYIRIMGLEKDKTIKRFK